MKILLCLSELLLPILAIFSSRFAISQSIQNDFVLDISTLTYNGQFGLSSQECTQGEIEFIPAGAKMFIIGNSRQGHQHSLRVAESVYSRDIF